MTKPEATTMTGEQRLKARSRKFWRYFALVCLVGALAGFGLGLSANAFEREAMPAIVPIGIALVIFAALVWFTFDYYRRIDEIDLMDNFWAHLIGLNIGAFAVLLWWVMSDIGLMRAPTGLEAVAIMAAVTVIAYTARKLGWR